MNELVATHNNKVLADFIEGFAPDDIRKKWVLWAFQVIENANKHGFELNPEWFKVSPNITGYDVATLGPEGMKFSREPYEPFWHQSQADQWNEEEGVGSK